MHKCKIEKIVHKLPRKAAHAFLIKNKHLVLMQNIFTIFFKSQNKLCTIKEERKSKLFLPVAIVEKSFNWEYMFKEEWNRENCHYVYISIDIGW